MAMLVTKLETSRDILLPKVKDRLCLLKIDRTIQTDLGIQLNVVLVSFFIFFFFFEKRNRLNLLALKCHHDQLPPTSYCPQISKLKVISSSHMMMKMEDAHSWRARQGPRLGDYLVIDTCLNKVGFYDEKWFEVELPRGRRQKPRGIGTTCSLLENAQSCRYFSKRKRTKKESPKREEYR